MTAWYEVLMVLTMSLMAAIGVIVVVPMAGSVLWVQLVLHLVLSEVQATCAKAWLRSVTQ
jgi:hypothetical protein